MPADKTATAPNGIVINFDEEQHEYTSTLPCGTNIAYTSITTFNKQFFPAFDSLAISKRVSEKTGESVQDILAKWEAKKNYACDVGTRVHEVAEDVVLERAIRNQPRDEHERLLMRQAWTAAKKVKSKMAIFGVEMILFDPKLQLAGTADLLAIDSKGVLWILDWKTNETIDTSSKYNSRGLYPIGHLHDCNAVHYALQLSFYEYMLRKGGYVLDGIKFNRAIIHITETGYQVIPLKSMAIEIRDMIIASNLNNVPF